VLGELAAETDYGYLRHINTDQTARDMLRIVEAHGRSKIQYWGFSYGSVLGATFAAMFPDKIERLVIDGVMDSQNYYDTLWSLNLLDTDKALETFFTGCAEAGPDGCHFWAPTPEDIRRNLTALYDSVRSQPRPIKTETSYGLLDYGMLRSAVFATLYSPYALFRILAQGLAELAAGDGRIIFELFSSPRYQCSCDPSNDKLDGQGDVAMAIVCNDGEEVPRDLASSQEYFDATMAILCNDGDDVPGDLKSSQEYFEMLTNASSWGEIWARIRLGCAGWPKFPKDHFQGPFEANTSHPILLVGNTADPVTPLWAAKKMSRGFKDSVVLTQNSAGHCSVSAPSLCTMKYIREYFVDGTLPDLGTVCEPIGKPFESPASEMGFGEDANQRALVAGMTGDEQEIFVAISELSKTPFLSFTPFVNPSK
jgi:pimeloyl-ACP methyl ester carboxylesterase